MKRQLADRRAGKPRHGSGSVRTDAQGADRFRRLRYGHRQGRRTHRRILSGGLRRKQRRGHKRLLGAVAHPPLRLLLDYGYAHFVRATLRGKWF